MMGLPTEQCGSWLSLAGTNSCGSATCASIAVQWRRLAQAGMKWASMVLMECVECATERQRRNRLIEPQDPRIRQSPFIDAPYVHQHNEPKYHAPPLRAVENAKSGGSTPAHILWVVAQDDPDNPAEVFANEAQMHHKKQRWLQYHDQMTAGIPGLLPLYLGMRARVTEKISKTLGILKHTPCTVVG